jgi:predicted DNA-binding transcriptional regulator YafY
MALLTEQEVKSSRLLGLAFILTERWFSTRELAERAGTAQRTAQRDIIALSRMFPVEERDGRSRWEPPRYHIPKSALRRYRDGV